jgi:hypothetical protein
LIDEEIHCELFTVYGQNILSEGIVRQLCRMFNADDEESGGRPSEVNVEVKSPPIVSRPVRFGVRYPSATSDQFFFRFEIVFRQLRICYFVAPSLTTGRVCNLLLLLVIASAVPRNLRPYTIFPIHETPKTLEGQVHVFIYPRNTMAKNKPLRTGFPFRRLRTTIFFKMLISKIVKDGASQF